MSKVSQIFVYSMAWYSPWTQPPEGMPRVLRWAQGGRDDLAAMAAAVQNGEIPDGYTMFICCGNPFELPRFQSGETVAKTRRTKMINEVKDQAPLFADEIIEQELKKDRYQVGTCQANQERKRRALQVELDKTFVKYAPEREVKYKQKGKK